MCRNIKTLFNFEPPATDEEIRASSLQFVRKVSGFNRPSKANEAAFDLAVQQVAAAARLLIASLVTNADPIIRTAKWRRRGHVQRPPRGLVQVRNRAGLPAAELAGLEAEVGGFESLADVLAWGRAQPAGSMSPLVIADVIVQDEFTRDAVVPLRAGRTLVFGST